MFTIPAWGEEFHGSIARWVKLRSPPKSFIPGFDASQCARTWNSFFLRWLPRGAAARRVK